MLVYGKNVAIEILKGNYKINKVFLDNNYKDEEILSLIDKVIYFDSQVSSSFLNFLFNCL